MVSPGPPPGAYRYAHDSTLPDCDTSSVCRFTRLLALSRIAELSSADCTGYAVYVSVLCLGKGYPDV